MKHFIILVLAVCGLAVGAAEISSVAQNGYITWMHTSSLYACTIEWASSAQGPWHTNWDTLSDLIASNGTNSASVPMFYRVSGVEFPWSGVVAHYAFTGNAGDDSGFGNHGSVSGASLTNDRDDNASSAYYFDGINAGISVSNSTSIDIHGSNSISVSVWFNASRLEGQAALISKWGTGGTVDDQYGMGVDSGRHAFFTLSDLSATVASPTVIDTGAWYHVVGVYNRSSGNLRLYLNGSEVASNHLTAYDLRQTTEPLNIGTSAHEEYWSGTIDDVFIYSRPLIPSEVRLLYAQ